MKTILLATAFATAMGAGAAFAQTNTNVNNSWMSVGDLTAKLEAQGYTVREVERDDDRYEVDVTDRDGVKWDARIDRSTGEILSRDRDDDNDNDND